MRRGQDGFTFIELMTASAAAAVVILAATGFLLRALGWYDELSAKIEMNRHARETYDLLAYGGASTSSGNDMTGYIYGLNGRNAAPASGLRNNDALQYISNNLTLTPDRFAAMTVTCTDAAKPVPDCKKGQNQTVQGWQGSDVQINSGTRSVAGETVEVIFTITDPFEAQRAKSPTLFTDTYRTVFTLNRNENDP